MYKQTNNAIESTCCNICGKRRHSCLLGRYCFWWSSAYSQHSFFIQSKQKQRLAVHDRYGIFRQLSLKQNRRLPELTSNCWQRSLCCRLRCNNVGVRRCWRLQRCAKLRRGCSGGSGCADYLSKKVMQKQLMSQDCIHTSKVNVTRTFIFCV